MRQRRPLRNVGVVSIRSGEQAVTAFEVGRTVVSLWIGPAIARHVHKSFLRRVEELKATNGLFDGAYEKTVVKMVASVFEGAGFEILNESKIYENSDARADLVARDVDGRIAWIVEGKLIWDGCDPRIGDGRLLAEVCKDLDRLARLPNDCVRVAIWVTFSSVKEIVSASNHDTPRYGDILRQVASQFPTACAAYVTTIDCQSFVACEKYARYAHVHCWVI